ncbi:hypothetical protein HYH03_009918 [Edaphochlamys debaryana]|uniref:phytol kinase n=1 Tax=Edaphochlamys debaryana TaxID=47281 RepID=A0A836BX81_9CHLO|nr:hypothetical protein HYH03_009918 [Edaphochlamys debaryana]|eukprot:KAG2491757.1 hypothetical protein HYH03_009918 [Edaphochlamys debaryana]
MQAALEAAERTVESEEPQHSSAARAILGDERLCVSLLRLVAFAVRLPAPDGGGADTLRRHQQRAVGHAACRLAAVVLAAPADCYPEAQQSFAEALLQTQTLHAAARQLAACAAALKPGPAPPSPALCVACLRCVTQALSAVSSIASLTSCKSTHEALAGDLAATHLLDHAARVLLLAKAGSGAEGRSACGSFGMAFTSLMALLPRGGGGQAAGPSEGGGAGGSGSGAGAGGHSGGAPAMAARLDSRYGGSLPEAILGGIMGRLLACPHPWQGPWPGLVEDTWRLAAALLRREVLCPGAMVLLESFQTSFGEHLGALLHLCCRELTVADDRGLCILPPAPPPGLSPALAGGALPLLERLLRRAGEDPAGPEASILYHAAYHEALLPLLAHGEPLQAGALVATVTKLLRRAEPLAMMGEGVGAMGLCMAYPVLTRVVDCGEAVQLPVAASPSRGAPSASPAAGRVALVLSLALPEWLPELSRLVRQAAAVDEAAWAEEQAWARRTAAASGGGGSSRGGGGRAEVADVPAVPPAPAGDLGALMKWMVAVLYHLAQAMVLADGSVPSACSDMGKDDSWWWGSVLEASDVFGLVGSGLRLLERRRPCPQAWYFLYELISSMAIRLFALWPECAYEALRAHDPPSACWRPEAVRALGAVMRGLGARPRTLEGLEVMAECLEAWAAGEEAEELPEDLPQAGTAWWAPLLVPPAEARRRLGLPPACSSPACASLAGDSEAGLRRQQCGRCGRASYCCRECQVAHWKAGHKEACGKAAADE